MSTSTNSATKGKSPQSVPAWITSGVLGLALGGGATFLAMHYFVLYPPRPSMDVPPPGMGGPAPGMGGGGMGGGGMGGGGMGGGGMGGGGMGGGMMGGGGGGGAAARAKRDLTSLVGKLDLLSQGVRVEVSPEQATELCEKLALLETAEKMTSDEAQANLESLEASLTDDQKAALASIELPRPPRSAGGGGPMGGGGPSRGMSGAGGGQPDDENPFRQETNQLRLTELLTRLKGSSPEAAPADSQ